LPHTKGEWAFKRQLIELEPWQLFIVCCAFGWVRKGSGLRRFREVYTEIPRKNGKSAISAGVGLYCFAADNEFGSEVYSGATTEKQAWEVFRPARLMAKRTPQLLEHFGIEVNASNLSIPADGARFEPLIGNPGDGQSPSCAVVDEYHEHDSDDLYTTMVTGSGADQLLADVTNALITHVDGARALGSQLLACSLARSMDSIELPISIDTGLILPGQVVQTPDGKGYSRRLRVSAQVGNDRKLVIRQSIEIERPLGV